MAHIYSFGPESKLVPAPTSPIALATPYSTQDIVTFLTQLIPYSLPILRRIQLGPLTSETLFITTPLPLNSSVGVLGTALSGDKDVISIKPESLWAMALVHRKNHPATEIWPFSSTELYHGITAEEKSPQPPETRPESFSLRFTPEIRQVAVSQLLTILSSIPITYRLDGVDLLEQAKTYGSPCILAGNIHSTVAALLEEAKVVLRPTAPYGKYFFSAAANPQALLDAPDGSSIDLPDGLIWSTIGPDDYADVMAVNKIVRSAKTIAVLPSAAIRERVPFEGRTQGKAIAFAFAAGDGSVRTLHVDSEYRRKGLAKAVVRRLLDSGSFEPPTQGNLAAREDIREKKEKPHPLAYSGIEQANLGSVNTFKALGAEWMWDVYWLSLDLDKTAEQAKLATLPVS